MNRAYHRWYSQRLHRDMELLVFGHAGAKVLIFPTRDGRFYEYEDLGLVDTLRPRVEAGDLQLFCVDSIDWETFYCFWCQPADRLRRHVAFEEYILNEVLPMMDRINADPCTIAHGLSLGAFHAANIAFRHPLRFQKLRAFSGRYDLTIDIEHFRDLLSGWRDEALFYHTPTRYLPSLRGWRLKALRQMDIVLAIGREDPFLQNNHRLCDVLTSLQVPHQLHEWAGRAHSARYWRAMVPLYL